MESIKKLEEKFVMNQRKNEDPRIKSSTEVVVSDFYYNILFQVYRNRLSR
jgi:hypothetical protein